jgi:hypothetical protein
LAAVRLAEDVLDTPAVAAVAERLLAAADADRLRSVLSAVAIFAAAEVVA